ncbi:MAG: HNH endonuclease [Puniceicoccales bacterium]|jgi:5-methylcytosine-specific restriction endonuclease McrA|nr:HNH endonuclease [Puniceicoccales bacterium]
MGSRLENRVLVLNRVWQPVNIIGVRRAITLLFQEHAQVVFSSPDFGYRMMNAAEWLSFSEENPDPRRSLRTIRLSLRIPPVLLLKSYDRLPRREVRFCRRNVYLRDGHCCQYCGRLFDEHELNLDHVIPRDRGGKTNWENIVTACVRCNARKANRLPQQAGMNLPKMPTRPKWRLFMASSLNASEVSDWRPFLEPLVAPSAISALAG